MPILRLIRPVMDAVGLVRRSGAFWQTHLTHPRPALLRYSSSLPSVMAQEASTEHQGVTESANVPILSESEASLDPGTQIFNRADELIKLNAHDDLLQLIEEQLVTGGSFLSALVSHAFSHYERNGDTQRWLHVAQLCVKFDYLPSINNIVSIIDHFGELGRFDDALKVYEALRRNFENKRRKSFYLATYAMIGNCFRTGNVQSGLQLNEKITAERYRPSPRTTFRFAQYLRIRDEFAALVRFLQQVYPNPVEMRPDLFLIYGLALYRNGQAHRFLELAHALPANRQSDKELLRIMFLAHSALKDIDGIVKLHERVKDDPSFASFYSPALAKSYLRCRAPERVAALEKELRKMNLELPVKIYAPLIRSYIVLGEFDEAQRVLNEGNKKRILRPSASRIYKPYIKSREMLPPLSAMESDGDEPELPSLITSELHAAAKESFDAAHNYVQKCISDRKLPPNLIYWRWFIACHAQSTYTEAWKVFELILDENLAINFIALHPLFRSRVNLDQTRLIERIMNRLIERNVDIPLDTCNEAILASRAAHSYSYLDALLPFLHSKGYDTVLSIAATYCDHYLRGRKAESALKHLQHVLGNLGRFDEELWSYWLLSNAVVKLSSIDKAWATMMESVDAPKIDHSFVKRTLLLCFQFAPKKGFSIIYDRFKASGYAPDQQIENLVLTFYAKSKQPGKALKQLESMQSRGVMPYRKAFVQLKEALAAPRHRTLLNRARKVLRASIAAARPLEASKEAEE